MKRTSKYHPLRWIVEARHNPHPCFEAIAAFNVDSVARGYAARCGQANPLTTYRVVERNGRGQWKAL